MKKTHLGINEERPKKPAMGDLFHVSLSVLPSSPSYFVLVLLTTKQNGEKKNIEQKN